jgi:hypothetical protein
VGSFSYKMNISCESAHLQVNLNLTLNIFLSDVPYMSSIACLVTTVWSTDLSLGQEGPAQMEDTLDHDTASEDSLPSMESREMYCEGSELSDWEIDHDGSPDLLRETACKPLIHMSMPSGGYPPPLHTRCDPSGEFHADTSII